MAMFVSFSSYKSPLSKLKRTRKCKQRFPAFIGMLLIVVIG